MGKLEAVAPSATIDTITDEQLKEYISSLVHRRSSGYEPAVMEQALASLSMPMHIVDPDTRVTHYCSDFFERLDCIGCGDFKTANPKKTVLLLLQKLQPSALRSEMRKRVKYDATLEKDVRRFIKVLTMEAKACQTYSTNATTKKTSSYPTKATSEKVRTKLDRDNPNKSNTTNTSKGEKSQVKSTPPLCLLPKHRDEGVRRYVRDCPSCEEDTKKRLLDELQSKKKGKGGSAKRARDPLLPPTNSSSDTSLGGKEEAGVVFSAVFAGKLIETVCADIGADTNLMDSALLDRLCAAGGEPNIEPLRKPRKFDMAAHTLDAINAEIVCTRSAVLHTELKVRPGTSLTLRNVRWLVTDQRVGQPGRPLLEALGLHTREILLAAADRYSGSVDVDGLLDANADYGAGHISRVLEGVYHADGGDDGSDTEEDAPWCDLGPETNEEWEQHMKLRLQEASSNGMSDSGLKRLAQMLRNYRDIVRGRLNGGPPARVEPLVLQVQDNAVAFRAKRRRYPPEKRAFLRRYVEQLMKLGFAKPAERTEWVSAPLIVPKKPPALYRLTVDYRSINPATRPITWPRYMPL